jgi:hypothetical protein
MDHHHIFPYFFVGGMVALGAAIIVISVLYARKRTRELAGIAQQIGFRFLGNTWSGPPLSASHKTSLLQRTRGKFSNVMTGSSGRLEISLFDYTYPRGKGSGPENFLDRIGDAIVHNDIDFDSNPEFSKRYLLKSPDEAGTRKLFIPSLLTYIEQLQTNWCIEGAGATLILYRGGKSARPSDVAAFLEETSRIARTFFASDGLRKPVA